MLCAEPGEHIVISREFKEEVVEPILKVSLQPPLKALRSYRCSSTEKRELHSTLSAKTSYNVPASYIKHHIVESLELISCMYVRTGCLFVERHSCHGNQCAVIYLTDMRWNRNVIDTVVPIELKKSGTVSLKRLFRCVLVQRTN